MRYVSTHIWNSYPIFALRIILLPIELYFMNLRKRDILQNRYADSEILMAYARQHDRSCEWNIAISYCQNVFTWFPDELEALAILCRANLALGNARVGRRLSKCLLFLSSYKGSIAGKTEALLYLGDSYAIEGVHVLSTRYYRKYVDKCTSEKRKPIPFCRPFERVDDSGIPVSVRDTHDNFVTREIFFRRIGENKVAHK